MTFAPSSRWTRLGRGALVSWATVLVVWAGASLQAEAVATRVVKRDVYLMGTRATLVASAASRSVAVESLDQMLETLERAEEELSTWRPASMLSRLNRQPVDEAWEAPEWLCEVLGELASWNRWTEGAFDPAIGSLIEAWDLRGDGRELSRAAGAAAHARTGLRHFRVRVFPCSVTRLVDATIDAGAFGKGLALDRVAALGRPGLVDLGGQVAVFDRAPGGGWPVTIAHPQHRELPVVKLHLTSGSLAVSGGSERDRWVGGERLGHIVDPRSGKPISRPISVAVWHERAMVADVLATALYVMGDGEGIGWAERMSIAACFLIPDDSTGSGSTPSVTLVATTAFRLRFLDPNQADVGESESGRDERVEDVEEHERRVR